MKKGQVLLTFDDGIRTHLDAGVLLHEHGLKAAFGIVTERVETNGFLTEHDLDKMKRYGHFICNHSHTHAWSGIGIPKAALIGKNKDQLNADYETARTRLNERGFHGDYLFAPFGTSNFVNPEHVQELLKEKFKWVRVTIGSPLPEEMGGWGVDGFRRMYPHDYSGRIIGVTAPAQADRQNDIKEFVDYAVKTGNLSVILWHEVTHVVGDGMAVTWERFEDDVNYIAKAVERGELECVSPNDLVKEDA